MFVESTVSDSTTFCVWHDEIIIVSVQRLMQSKTIRIFDETVTDYLATLNLCHCPYKTAKARGVCFLYDFVAWQLANCTYMRDIGLCIVFAWWRPSLYDFVWGVYSFLQIVEENNECGTKSVLHAYELTESFVGLFLPEPLPVIAQSNVERIVISYASWQRLSHNC